MTIKWHTDLRTLGCAAALGVAIALPAGIFVGRHGAGGQTEAASERTAATANGRRTRDVYSPTFRDDPYVIEQQRRIVEALENSCSKTKEHCGEAAEAQRRIEEAAAGR